MGRIHFQGELLARHGTNQINSSGMLGPPVKDNTPLSGKLAMLLADLSRRKPPHKIPPEFIGRGENTKAPLEWRHLLPVHGIRENDTAALEVLKEQIRVANTEHKERHMKLPTTRQPREKDDLLEPAKSKDYANPKLVFLFMYIRWLYSDYFDYPLGGQMDYTQLRLPC